jgi:hypothetical protein
LHDYLISTLAYSKSNNSTTKPTPSIDFIFTGDNDKYAYLQFESISEAEEMRNRLRSKPLSNNSSEPLRIDFADPSKFKKLKQQQEQQQKQQEDNQKTTKRQSTNKQNSESFLPKKVDVDPTSKCSVKRAYEENSKEENSRCSNIENDKKDQNAKKSRKSDESSKKSDEIMNEQRKNVKSAETNKDTINSKENTPQEKNLTLDFDNGSQSSEVGILDLSDIPLPAEPILISQEIIKIASLDDIVCPTKESYDGALEKVTESSLPEDLKTEKRSLTSKVDPVKANSQLTTNIQHLNRPSKSSSEAMSKKASCIVQDQLQQHTESLSSMLDRYISNEKKKHLEPNSKLSAKQLSAEIETKDSNSSRNTKISKENHQLKSQSLQKPQNQQQQPKQHIDGCIKLELIKENFIHEKLYKNRNSIETCEHLANTVEKLWQGLFTLKKFSFPISMHFLAGNYEMAKQSLSDDLLDANNVLNKELSQTVGVLNYIHVGQRLKLEKRKLEELENRLINLNKKDNSLESANFSIILSMIDSSAASAQPVNGGLQQKNSLNCIISYLNQKCAIGVVAIPCKNTNSTTCIYHIYPPNCTYTIRLLRQLMPAFKVNNKLASFMDKEKSEIYTTYDIAASNYVLIVLTKI